MAKTPEDFMGRAIRLSCRGFPAPNPRVGCVIVKDGLVVGEGFHDHAGGPHAEIVALADAGERARGADVYVTLEPCAHTGKTPPCTEALVNAQVARVTAAVSDPNPLAAGGLDRLCNAGIEVHSGLLERQAEAVNWRFLMATRSQRARVCVKAAITIDGFMARGDGSSQWITGPLARRAGQRLRAEMGAVLVGRQTIRHDNPILTARSGRVVNQPVRLVLDPQGTLTGSELVFGPDAETLWCVLPGHQTADRQTPVPGENGEIDLLSLLKVLYEKGVNGVLVEGGPRTIHRFFEVGLVDRLELFTGPVFFGEGLRFQGKTGEKAAWNLVESRRIGPDLHAVFVPSREPL